MFKKFRKHCTVCIELIKNLPISFCSVFSYPIPLYNNTQNGIFFYLYLKNKYVPPLIHNGVFFSISYNADGEAEIQNKDTDLDSM